MRSILTDYLGTVCGACGQRKQTNHSFCYTCFKLLPEDMRTALYKRFGAGYEEAFTAALEFLKQPRKTTDPKLPAIKFPATSSALRAAGYEYDNDGKCKGCQASVEWWITPNGRKMPLTVKRTANLWKSTDEVRMPHHAECPNVEEFRRSR